MPTKINTKGQVYVKDEIIWNFIFEPNRQKLVKQNSVSFDIRLSRLKYMYKLKIQPQNQWYYSSRLSSILIFLRNTKTNESVSLGVAKNRQVATTPSGDKKFKDWHHTSSSAHSAFATCRFFATPAAFFYRLPSEHATTILYRVKLAHLVILSIALIWELFRTRINERIRAQLNLLFNDQICLQTVASFQDI